MRWIPLTLVLAAEFVLFLNLAAVRHAQVYPRWNDQIQPLTEAYTTYEVRRQHGFWAGVNHALSMPAAQGNQHALWALLAFEVGGGPSRRATLAVNMLAFLAWQAALVAAVARAGSRALPWLAIGLTLALQWPWSGIQGAATDFRLDHATLCLMGISLAVALQTDGFRLRAWSVAFGVAVGFTIITRFLSAAYFTLIFGAILGWALLAGDRTARARNLMFAGLAAAAVVLPVFWLHRRDIYDHYWIGHYHQADGLLWSSGLSFGRAFLRIWQQHLGEQVGAMFWLAAALAAGILTAGLHRARGVTGTSAATDRVRWPRQAAILGGIFLLAPVLVLSAQNNDKMVVVVLGAAVPGTVVLVLALAAWLEARVGPRLAGLAAAAALIVGGSSFWARQAAPVHSEAFFTDARRVAEVADHIQAAAQVSGLTAPRIAVDYVTDCLDGSILSVIGYERHQVWMPYVMQLPTGISRAPEELLMQHLANSDFVFVTEEGPVGEWPYERQMAELRPQILAWCQENLRLAERFEVFGRRLALYQRPDIGTAPVFAAPARLLASSTRDFTYGIRITKGAARYQATGLPPGLAIDADTGAIKGRPAQAGSYPASITATNAAGTSTHAITFQVNAAGFFAVVQPPAAAVAGNPVEIGFEAFDADGHLDFIEITDLTSQRALDRVTAGADQRQNWSGCYRLAPADPGVRSLLLRFVRLHPDAKGRYDFIDRNLEITVTPRP